MNPAIALALVAIVGLLVSRAPRLPSPRSPIWPLVRSGGASLVILGIALGPGIGVLDHRELAAGAPLVALALGWLGADLGARFDRRLVRRIPRAIWLAAAAQAALVLAVVGGGAWVLARFVPPLFSSWAPRPAALLTLAAVAITSGSRLIALATQPAGAPPARVRALRRAATLDEGLGAVAFVIALAVNHARGPAGAALLGVAGWLAASVGAGAVVAGIALAIAPVEQRDAERDVPLLATLLLGAGIGYAAGWSPFVVCGVAALTIAALSPARRRLRAALGTARETMEVACLIFVGAALRVPTAWLLAGGVALAALRVAAKSLRVPDSARAEGRLTIAQGSTALVLAASGLLALGGIGEGSGAVVATVAVAVVVAQWAAIPLARRALAASRLTPPPLDPELSPTVSRN